MAHIYKTHRALIAARMATNDEDRKWLSTATFAKTDNGYWLAWQPGDLSRAALLGPDHPKTEPCRWLESRGKNDTVEGLVEYVASGQLERDGPMELNILIQNPETGEWE